MDFPQFQSRQCPPPTEKQNFYMGLADLYEKFRYAPLEGFIMGDFNCRLEFDQYETFRSIDVGEASESGLRLLPIKAG